VVKVVEERFRRFEGPDEEAVRNACQEFIASLNPDQFFDCSARTYVAERDIPVLYTRKVAYRVFAQQIEDEDERRGN